MKSPFYIHRFYEPAAHDTAEQGTICKVNCAERGLDIYYQLSKDAEHPNWVFIGNFPSTTAEDVILNHIKNRFETLP